MPTKILVCGGRNYINQKFVNFVMNQVLIHYHDIIVMNGGARGADLLSSIWARKLSIPVEIYNALWNKYGRDAGPERNRRMLQAKPTLVVAFPGGSGTNHMVRISRMAGIKVIEPKEDMYYDQETEMARD